MPLRVYFLGQTMSPQLHHIPYGYELQPYRRILSSTMFSVSLCARERGACAAGVGMNSNTWALSMCDGDHVFL